MPDAPLDDDSIIGECLRAAVDGPFFPEWEFETLVGMDRPSIERILWRWPSVRASLDECQTAALQSCIGNLLGYPHGHSDRWKDFISVSPAEVGAVLARWRESLSTTTYPTDER